APGEGRAEPGQVLQRDGILAIGTGEGVYVPARLQLEGRSSVSAAEFVHGYPSFMGARLGEA
ncbi:MAG: methionyl-tRNA formyltransferase, partial [Anaerolineae bacterium]